MSHKSKLQSLILLATVAVCLLSVPKAFAGTTTYIYDELDRLQEVQYPDGYYIAYDYDEIGNMTAKRKLATTRLAVTKAGTCTGTVTGGTATSPADISCGSACQIVYKEGTTATLSAAEDAYCVFAGWTGGGCSGTGNCTLVMNTISTDLTVTATFNKLYPTANFSASPTTAGAPIIVSFTNLSQSATSWLWNFGDGTTSTEPNPAHYYQAPGTYTVSLTATNVNGSTTATKTGYIITTSCPPVRILGKSSYTTLQAAYNAAVDGDVIQSLAQTFIENLAANRPVSVTIDGGYTCDYTSNSDKTILRGAPALTNGTVTMKNFHIQQ